MRHELVPTIGAVLVRALRPGAMHRICGAHSERVLVHMIAMRMVEMSVMQIIDVAVMTDGSVSAIRAMLVSMIRMVLLGTGVHRVSPFLLC
jgi:hypothetical protein